jgi:hypothetical protein
VEKSKLTVKPESNFGRQIINNNFRHGGKNYYIVQDTRSKVVKIYDGDKGRELAEQGFKYDKTVAVMERLKTLGDWREFQDHIFNIV